MKKSIQLNFVLWNKSFSKHFQLVFEESNARSVSLMIKYLDTRYEELALFRIERQLCLRQSKKVVIMKIIYKILRFSSVLAIIIHVMIEENLMLSVRQ